MLQHVPIRSLGSLRNIPLSCAENCQSFLLYYRIRLSTQCSEVRKFSSRVVTLAYARRSWEFLIKTKEWQKPIHRNVRQPIYRFVRKQNSVTKRRSNRKSHLVHFEHLGLASTSSKIILRKKQVTVLVTYIYLSQQNFNKDRGPRMTKKIQDAVEN